MVKVRLLLPVLLLMALACSAVHAVTIGEVKSSYPDGASVFVRGVVTYITPTELCIQSGNRSAGIWAEADTTGLAIGNEVYLTGDIATQNGERIIRRTYITKNGTPLLAGPLAMLNKSLGGAALGLQPGLDDRRPVLIPAGSGWAQDWQWATALGPNNLGLLVKTWGTVTAVSQSATDGTKWFHIDDGSRVLSDLGDWGVLVYSDAPVKQGDQVAVTGISSLESCIDIPEKTIRVLRTRSVDDVQVTKPVEVLTRPFSDEFIASVLDPRWLSVPGSGSVSVTSNPGAVRMIMPVNGGVGPKLIQLHELAYPGGLDIRLSVNFSTLSTVKQTFAIYFADSAWTNYLDKGRRRLVSVERSPYWLSGFTGTYVILPTANGDVYLSPYSGGNIDFSLRGNCIYVTYGGVQRMYKDTVGTDRGRYLVMALYSPNQDVSDTPFSAYVDYVRVIPNLEAQQ